jgi:hypothetical protein
MNYKTFMSVKLDFTTRTVKGREWKAALDGLPCRMIYVHSLTSGRLEYYVQSQENRKKQKTSMTADYNAFVSVTLLLNVNALPEGVRRNVKLACGWKECLVEPLHSCPDNVYRKMERAASICRRINWSMEQNTIWEEVVAELIKKCPVFHGTRWFINKSGI